MEAPLKVRKTIKEFGPANVHRAMGVPFSTIWRWMENDKIPGKGAAHDWRVSQFRAAIEKLRAEKANEAKAA